MNCEIKTDFVGREWHVGDFILVAASNTVMHFGRICGFTPKQIKYKYVGRFWLSGSELRIYSSHIKQAAFAIITQHSIPEHIFRMLDAVELK